MPEQGFGSDHIERHRASARTAWELDSKMWFQPTLLGTEDNDLLLDPVENSDGGPSTSAGCGARRATATAHTYCRTTTHRRRLPVQKSTEHTAEVGTGRRHRRSTLTRRRLGD
jgi:hypothetical protein